MEPTVEEIEEDCEQCDTLLSLNKLYLSEGEDKEDDEEDHEDPLSLIDSESDEEDNEISPHIVAPIPVVSQPSARSDLPPMTSFTKEGIAEVELMLALR